MQWFGFFVALSALLWAGQPQIGGVLHVAQRAEPKTFNPIFAIDAPSREVLRRMHADLISIDRSTFKTVPSLAESWNVSKDGRTYRLKLRSGVRFSDGHPFTADDVVFTFAVHQDAAVGSAQRDLLTINGKAIQIAAVNSHEVKFELPQPYAAAERLFDSIAILPKHQLETAWKSGKLKQAWTLATQPQQMAVLGPFRLKDYKPGQAVTLERNPYYWQKGKPYLYGIEFRLIPDDDTQLANFVSGRLDLMSRLQPSAIQYLTNKQFSLTDLGASLEYNFVCFNLSSAGGSKAYLDREFRKALSSSVDRTSMAKAVYGGRGTPIWSPVSPSNKAWYVPPTAQPNHAVAEAKAKLKAAGYRWNAGNELLDSAGKPVTFTILVSASSAERIRMANMAASDWKELGVAAQVVTLEFRSLIERVLTKRDFDAVVLGLGGGDADPNADMNVWLSSGGMHLWNPEQAKPATAWEAELDGLMRQQMVTPDYAKRRKVYQKALGVIEREQPMIFLVTPNVVTAQGGRVGNFRPALMDHYTLWNAAELYLIGK